MLMILSVALPVAAALLIPVLKPEKPALRTFVGAAAVLTGVVAAASAFAGGSVQLLSFGGDLTVRFAMDGLAVFFTLVVAAAFTAVCFYSFKYIEHEGADERFFAFYLLSYAFMLAVCCSANLVTLYFFFECVTLSSMPLVLHSLKKEAVSAALKYLFYSIAGALLALLGIFFVWYYSAAPDFVFGGSLDLARLAGHEGVLRAVVFLAIVGFGTKAGMYPMHGWLPTAHPVAPGPASALLSAIIAKAGIIAVVRLVYYAVGADFLRGSWVQTAWTVLALITVLMGSMMAYREKLLKKRLAYSTVSNVSYIMLGLSCLSAEGLAGGLMHVAAHAAAKTVLFLVAGTIIFKENKTRVDELAGIGRRMPVTMWCFTVSSLSLIGIPPLAGFVSKWYISGAAVAGDMGAFSYLIPAVLLVSALLTAGYLLSIVIDAFFPGREYDRTLAKTEPSLSMCIPMVAVTAAGVLTGLFAGGLHGWFLSFM